MKDFIFIAHRGNINGPNFERENSPQFIQEALENGYWVEIDVWVKNNKITLGHNEGIYEVDSEFLENERFFCHAKNIEAAEYMNNNKKIHWFWHQEDDCTLTSKGLIWTFPHCQFANSIMNQPEFNQRHSPEKAAEEAVLRFKQHLSTTSYLGVCSDYIEILRNFYNE